MSDHVIEIIDASDCSADRISEAKVCIYGIPTWDFGGGQGDWDDFKEELEAAELAGKKVALYGLGDQFGYEFTESRASSPCRTYFYGLAVDDDQ